MTIRWIWLILGGRIGATIQMKKLSLLLFTLVTMALTGLVQAQNYKKFKVGLGLGPALDNGDFLILGAIEPAYRITDAWAIGLRVESAPLIGYVGSASANTLTSYTLNAQFYFSEGKLRPFVGLGAGTYLRGSTARSQIGFYPRAGFDFGHFNLSLDYNILSRAPSSSTVGTFNNGYFGIRIGGFFGGSKR